VLEEEKNLNPNQEIEKDILEVEVERSNREIASNIAEATGILVIMTATTGGIEEIGIEDT
jgi:pyrrolidone-carboxylate peptidase